MRIMNLSLPALALVASSVAAQKVAIDPEHVAITEPVEGSSIPVELMYVGTRDGLYTAIGLRKPAGDGPFPIVLFASGNGGGGMGYIVDVTQNQSWTQEQFLAAGYAVAWLRYRTEVDSGYNKGGKLVVGKRTGRDLMNRGVLEYEDVISVIDYVKALPYIDPDRVGYFGMSHGGEMAFKIATEYHGLRAAIASEPATHEYLAVAPDNTAHVDEKTGTVDVEHMLMRESDKVRARVDMNIARARIGAITTPIFVQGRNSDELEGLFKVTYDLLREAGKETQWKTYEHDEHGFVLVKRNAKGKYAPDAVQREAVADSLAWFDRYMKSDTQPVTGSAIEYDQPFYND